MPNPSLTSESIYNYEVSASNKISSSVTADIDLYYSTIKDVVRPVHVTAFYLQNENIASYRIKGIQSNLYYKSPDKKWQETLNYSYTYSISAVDIDTLGVVVNQHSRSSAIAPHKANAIINYLFFKKFNINLRTNYVSEKRIGPLTNVRTFNGYVLSNITLSASDLVKGACVQFICNNIFNTRYYSPGLRSDGLRAPDRILQMERTFALKINYTL